MDDWFNEKKSAQIVAFFCAKNGGQIDVLKLIKLVYLADRECMGKSGFPITNDRFVAMPHGPANSMTLNYVDGNLQSSKWADLISDRDQYQVGLSRELTDDDNDELSEFEFEVLNSVWDEFGHMGKWKIRDWTHINCPEWENPEGSSNPIPHSRLLKFLNVPSADDISNEIAQEREIDSLFQQLRV